MRITAAALMLIVLPACSDLQVKTEQDWDADFARYRTYAWGQGTPARDPSIESQIRAAVDFELPFKGLKKVEQAASPDLYVATYASVEEEQVVGQWGHEARTDGAADSRFSTLTLPIGTLVVELVDARSDKLVWRGHASKAVDRQVSEASLRKVVRDIFRHYPWKD
jgi:hypothetical protein